MADERIKIAPDHITYTDEDHTKFFVEAELPGVEKDQIQFRLLDDTFYLSATTADKHYLMYHATCHPVIPDKAKAKYENGLLTVEVPFQDVLKGAVNLKIE